MHKYLHLKDVFGLFLDIFAPRNVCVKDIGSLASMVLQNYQKFSEMTSNMIYIVAFGVGLKCQHKIHLNTQWGRGVKNSGKIGNVIYGWPLTDCGLIQSDVQTYSNGSSNVFSRFKWDQTSRKRSKKKGKTKVVLEKIASIFPRNMCSRWISWTLWAYPKTNEEMDGTLKIIPYPKLGLEY